MYAAVLKGLCLFRTFSFCLSSTSAWDTAQEAAAGWSDQTGPVQSSNVSLTMKTDADNDQSVWGRVKLLTSF
jgi:hypothetical protein